jgi:hypothetical protein
MPRLLSVRAFIVVAGSAVFGPTLIDPPTPATSGLLITAQMVACR